VIVGTLASSQLWAEELDLSSCAFPEVPDGNVASTEQLSAPGKAVRAFASTMQGQLDCLDGIQASLGDGITQDEQATITVAYNAGVDQLNATSTRYNEAVRTYKSNAE
jgi:hypothetical protein